MRQSPVMIEVSPDGNIVVVSMTLKFGVSPWHERKFAAFLPIGDDKEAAIRALREELALNIASRIRNDFWEDGNE